MKTQSFLIATVFTIVFTSCDYWGVIYFYNDSDTELFASMAYGYMPPKSLSSYPDTLLPDADEESYYKIFTKVPAHTSRDLLCELGGGNMDNNYLIDNYISVDTVCVFVISPDTFSTYGYVRMAKENHILARYDLSKKDLKQLDARIH